MGDLGHGHKTWAPESGEQGISNRPDDEGDTVPDGPDDDEEDDDAAFNGDDDDDDDDDDADEDENEDKDKS